MLIQEISEVISNKLNPSSDKFKIYLDVTEAEKCMSYLIYTSPMVQKLYSISGVADAITQRIKETTEKKLNDDIRFFDMRLLCLLTSVNPNIR
jgi:hypothetical protein